MRFRRQFLHMMWPIQLVLLLNSLWYVLHFSYNRCNWSSPSFSSTTFQNFAGISDLISEVSKIQQHKNLCTKCAGFLFKLKSNLLVKRALFLLNAVFAMAILDLILVFTYIFLPVLLYSVFKINALFIWLSRTNWLWYFDDSLALNFRRKNRMCPRKGMIEFFHPSIISRNQQVVILDYCTLLCEDWLLCEINAVSSITFTLNQVTYCYCNLFCL
jgi:ribosomal protein S27AE